ncbi:toxin Cry1Ac domain D-VI-related protein, partial [Enterococcus faecalis]|uniref:toxin Cry1Ac domain D-VI-related protein n=1 Tax=Enterococcus faecalis TaxID=1351 RepID=UPI00235F00D8
MKKRETEKQLKKRMTTAKKGPVLAATALILSNSPVSVVTAFAENQANSEVQLQPIVQQEKQTVEVKSTIDQSIYGNLLKNPTLQIADGRITDWTTFIQTASGDFSSDQLKNVSFTQSGDKYLLGGQSNYIKETSESITLGSGQTQTGILSSPVDSIKGRTYSAKINVTEIGPSGRGYWLILRSNGVTADRGGWYRTLGVFERSYKTKSDNEKLSFDIGLDISSKYFTISRNATSFGLKYADQWKQVDALFTSLDHTELAAGVTKDTINQARAMVNSITNNKDATEMNEALAKADALYEKNIVDALDSVLNNGQLAPGTSQEDIDNLQDLINQLPDGEKKQELQDKLNQAQELLTNQQNAQTAVDNLFDNGQLKPTVSQSDIDQAQQLIDKLPEGEKKQELQGKLTQAKEQFKQLQAAIQSAQTAVDNLFNNGQLITNITQEAIDQAQELVNKLPEGEKKQELQGKLTQAKEQFNQQQAAIQAAQTAVDKLFGSNGQLAPNVTQEMIEETQELINKAPDGNKKQELQTKLDKAQKLYNQQVLAEVTVMVNGWFTDASHTALKEGVTTDDIERAIELLGQLPESSETDKLA